MVDDLGVPVGGNQFCLLGPARTASAVTVGTALVLPLAKIVFENLLVHIAPVHVMLVIEV